MTKVASSMTSLQPELQGWIFRSTWSCLENNRKLRRGIENWKMVLYFEKKIFERCSSILQKGNITCSHQPPWYQQEGFLPTMCLSILVVSFGVLFNTPCHFSPETGPTSQEFHVRYDPHAAHLTMSFDLLQ